MRNASYREGCRYRDPARRRSSRRRLARVETPLMFMLLLGASASVSLGQVVICDECDHIAPYFKGGGGFIGTVADGVEEVTFVTSCGSVSITDEADINDGTASQLFNGMNGFACDEDGGSLEIAGLEDGGWYWITDAMNSAVGPLVNKDVLENDMTMPVDPGSDDIVLTAGNGATFIRQLSTGRVGILPNILPEPPTPTPPFCGSRIDPADTRLNGGVYNEVDEGDPPVNRATTECMTGSHSSFWINLRYTDRFGRSRQHDSDSRFVYGGLHWAPLRFNPGGRYEYVNVIERRPGGSVYEIDLVPGLGVSGLGLGLGYRETAAGWGYYAGPPREDVSLSSFLPFGADVTLDFHSSAEQHMLSVGDDRCLSTYTGRSNPVEITLSIKGWSGSFLPSLAAEGVSRKIALVCPSVDDWKRAGGD